MRTRKIKVEAIGERRTPRIPVATFSAAGGTRTYAISQQTVAALMPLLARLQRLVATSKLSERPSATGTKNTGRSRPSRKSGSRQKKNRGNDG